MRNRSSGFPTRSDTNRASQAQKIRVATRQGKVREIFQGQGIVREFCKLSEKFGNIVKCQGIVREF